MSVAVLGTACVTSLAAEEAAYKDCISVPAAVAGILASCYLTASPLWSVDHIQGDCVITIAAVEASRIQKQ